MAASGTRNERPATASVTTSPFTLAPALLSCEGALAGAAWPAAPDGLLSMTLSVCRGASACCSDDDDDAELR